MAGFTPGPWYPGCICIDDSSCNCTSIVDEGYAGGIASVHVNNGIASITEGGNDAPPLEEAKANSRLISAAPDMYDALLRARMFIAAQSLSLDIEPEDERVAIAIDGWIGRALAKADGE